MVTFAIVCNIGCFATAAGGSVASRWSLCFHWVMIDSDIALCS